MPRPGAHLLFPGLWLGLAALILSTSLIAASGAHAELVEGDNRRTLIWDGISRPYIIHAPPGLDAAAPTPLLVAMHGFTSNASAHASISGMSHVADERGFVAVYPQGAPVDGSNSWNAGGCCQGEGRKQNDIGFIRAVVDAVKAETQIDDERIYATGLSNGGAMTQYLACHATDLFAAMAPVAFGLSDPECDPARPMPIINFMGLNDKLVPYEGGLGEGAVASFEKWRGFNACGEGEPEVMEVMGGSDCMIDTSCGGGVQTALCSVDSRFGAGTFFEGHIVYSNPDIDVARAAWDFMSQFTRTVPEPATALLQVVAMGAIVGVGRKRRR